MSDSPAALLRREKEQARAILADAYAEDLIDQSELDLRLEGVERATAIAEIRELTRELTAPEPAPASTALVPVAADASVQRIPVLLGSVERAGAWTLSPRTFVRVILGSALLDLRQAILPSGPVEIEVRVYFGSLDVIVPPGWRIDNRCGAVLAAVEQDDTTAPEGGRVLRLTGSVVFGSLSVRERLPGERPGDAKRRRKGERKALAERSARALPGESD